MNPIQQLKNEHITLAILRTLVQDDAILAYRVEQITRFDDILFLWRKKQTNQRLVDEMNEFIISKFDK